MAPFSSRLYDYYEPRFTVHDPEVQQFFKKHAGPDSYPGTLRSGGDTTFVRYVIKSQQEARDIIQIFNRVCSCSSFNSNKFTVCGLGTTTSTLPLNTDDLKKLEIVFKFEIEQFNVPTMKAVTVIYDREGGHSQFFKAQIDKGCFKADPQDY